MASIEVIPADHIGQVTRPVAAATSGHTVFTITSKDGASYQIEEPKESALFEGIIALAKRSRALNAITNRVKVDTSTLQWLMLILGFVNMVNDTVRPIVRKSALDLVSAVFSTFSLKHESNVTKVAIESLPENLLGFVTILAEDIALHNSQCYDGFLGEFFNAYAYVEKACKPVTLHFLRPWIKYWAADINNHPEFIDRFLKAYKDLPFAGPAFSLNIWRELVHETQAVRAVMQRICERGDDQLTPVVSAFGCLTPEVVSSFWVDTALADCATKKRDNVVYCCGVICSMLVSHTFHFGEPFRSLVYQVTRLRLIYDQEVLVQCAGFIAALFHTLVRLSKTSLPIDFTIVSAAFWATPALGDFVSGQNHRTWLTLSTVFASALRRAIVDEPFAEALYRRFIADIESPDVAAQASALVFAGSLAGENGTDFLALAIRLMRERKDDRVTAAVSVALALLMVDADVASRLFFLSVGLTLYLRGSPPLPLMASAVKQLGSGELCASVPSECVESISQRCGLDFVEDPAFAALLLLGAFAEAQDLGTIQDFVAARVSDPLVKVFSLVIGPEQAEAAGLVDFGSHIASVAAVVLKLLTVFPKPDLVEYAVGLAETRPSVFAGVPIFQGDLAMKLVGTVDDPALFAALAYATIEQPSEETPVAAPILATVYQPGGGSYYLDWDALDALITQLFA
jgi:hypothetical protein